MMHLRLRATLAVAAGSLTFLAACTAGTPASPQATSVTQLPATTTDTAPITEAPANTTPPSPAVSSSASAPASAAGNSCTATTNALPLGERIGQLLMVGMQPAAAPRGLDGTLTTYRVGSVIYLGGWQGQAKVAATSSHLQSLVTGTTRLLIAADQEGGQVQQLKGSGFTPLPSALAQGSLSSATLATLGRTMAGELRAAGVNVNLAPVGDTVPAGTEKTNGPIGRYSRQFGSDPTPVAQSVATLVTVMQEGDKVVATVKHFPGIGRITGNTDTTASGISDSAMRVDDPSLQPFAAAISAKVGMVMVSSARYPLLDPGAQALFSKAIVTDLLRGRLGFHGVVITDDVGAAKAVADVPVGARAVRFIDAGGDIVLTANPAQVPTMVAALKAEAAAHPAFAAKIDAAAARVLALKARFGLATCS